MKEQSKSPFRKGVLTGESGCHQKTRGQQKLTVMAVSQSKKHRILQLIFFLSFFFPYGSFL